MLLLLKQNFSFCVVQISLDNLYQTICWYRSIHCDCIMDGLPELQALLLRESQIKPRNCVARWCPISVCKEEFSVRVRRIEGVSIVVATGSTVAKKRVGLPFRRISQSSCNETSFRNGSLVPRDECIPTIHKE